MTKLLKLYLEVRSQMSRNLLGTNRVPSNNKDMDSVVPMLNGDAIKVSNWKLPVFSSFTGHDFKENIDANKYLIKQMNRINKAIINGNKEKAIKIWIILFQRSHSYFVFFLNRTLRGWYFKYTTLEVKRLFVRIKRINQRLDMNAIYRRVYIPKSNGKIRPLGVPKPEWRVTLCMINDLLYRMVETSIDNDQYGFRPKRNVWMAWERIIYHIQTEGKMVFEFDLDSCFNKISVKRCLSILEGLNVWGPFRLYLKGLLTTSPLVDDNLMQESEMQKTKLLYFDGRNSEHDIYQTPMFYKWAILKFGMPQGWSLSPLLSILTIDAAFKLLPKSISKVLYADDGLLFYDNQKDLDDIDWSSINKFGVYLSGGLKKDGRPKVGMVKDEFTFLGITYSISRDAFFIPHPISGMYTWMKRSPEVMKLLKLSYQGQDYDRSGKEQWTWSVKKDSWIDQNYKWWHLNNLLCFILWMMGKKDIRRFGWLFISYATMSSYACQDLLKNQEKWSKNSTVLRKRNFVKKFASGYPEIYKFSWDRDFVNLVRNEYEGGTKLGIVHLDFPGNYQYQSDIDLRIYLDNKRYDRDILYVDPDITLEHSKSYRGRGDFIFDGVPIPVKPAYKRTNPLTSLEDLLSEFDR